MMVTKIKSKGVQNFGYFEVDSEGIVHYLCSDICVNLDLVQDKRIGLPIEHFFKCQVSRGNLKEIEKNPQTDFGLIGEESCLVHITPYQRENGSGFKCQ